MRSRTLAGACVAALMALPSSAAAQTTFNPTRFDDPTPNGCLPADCSLREAVDAAPNASQPVTINLRAGRYEFQQPAYFRFPSSSQVTLRGAGARLTTIDANGLTRPLYVEEGSATTVQDLELTGGNADAGPNTPDPGFGGAIYVQGAGGLTLNRIAVTGNAASAQGGAIFANSALTVTDSTISGNTVGSGGSGGAIYILNSGNVSLTNTTIAGNAIASGGSSIGGAIFNNGDLALTNVTIARNTATGGAFYTQPTTFAVLRNTIIASDTGPACEGGPSVITGDHNLADDATCLLDGAGDKQGVNPLLGALAANGGSTNTLALSPFSPAINAGSGCPALDQRGIARAGACDIGAYEYRPARLTVITRVVNGQGGTRGPGDFSVHVRAGADVAGSPAPGTAGGRTYTLAPGVYAVSQDADARYATSYAGACGAVALGEGQAATCTITNDDKPPVVGKVVNALPERGTVKIKLPGRKHFRRLSGGEQLPIGTIVDTRNGRITLITAANTSGGTATAVFYAGIFKIGQSKGSKPITTLTLVEKLTGCKSSGKASAAAAKRKVKKRRLWGDGKGRFRTKGKHSAATVVGTKWLVEDRCRSTLTRVSRGRVKVRDFVKRRTVLVKAGKKYVARAR